MMRRRLMLSSAFGLVSGAAWAQRSCFDSFDRCFSSGPPAGPSLTLDFVTSGADARLTTVRAAGGATYFDPTGTMQLASANTQRIDYNPTTLAIKGLLIEESRVNSIRNPRAEGAVAATPGTPPTNWFVSSNAAGLTSTIVGSGIESGIPYLDWQLSGTTTASGSMSLSFEQNTTMTAAQNQVWTASVYARLISGSLAGLGSSVLLDLTERNSSGNPLSDHVTNIFASLTSAPLATQRYGVVGATLSNASTAFVGFNLFLNNIPTSSTVSFTIRVGAPQVELGAFVTSPILPAIGTPAATTRAVDVVTMTSTLFSQSQASLVVEALHPTTTTAANLFQMGGGSQTFRAFYRNAGVEPATAFEGTLGGGGDVATLYGNVIFKYGLAYTSTAFGVSVNSTPYLTGTAITGGPVSNQFNLLNVGGNIGGGLAWNGYIRKLTYWPRALSSAELQAATT